MHVHGSGSGDPQAPRELTGGTRRWRGVGDAAALAGQRPATLFLYHGEEESTQHPVQPGSGEAPWGDNSTFLMTLEAAEGEQPGKGQRILHGAGTQRLRQGPVPAAASIGQGRAGSKERGCTQ